MDGPFVPEACSGGAPGSTSSSLLDRIKQRDADAWQRLTDLYSPSVYGWCRHSGVPADDAADVLQEVFVAVARGIAAYRHDRQGDTFRGWLWTITQNKIRDHFRARRAESRAAGGTDAQQRLAQVPEELPSTWTCVPSAGQGPSPEQRAVELARAGVENRTWQAFWRLTVEALPAAEVAEQLGMTVAAVYKAKYRVMRLVRRELDDLVD
jgi:RNA polymerase sigma-70 factor, ECF subfamily